MHWLWLIGLCACGRLGFEEVTGASSGDGGEPTVDSASGGDDAMTSPIDSSPSSGTCTDPGNGCTFSGTVPCSCFGTAMMVSTTMTEAAGTLTITPNANTFGAQGSCLRSSTAFGEGGALIEISQVVSGAQGLTAIQVGNSPDVYTLSVLGTNMIAEDSSGQLASIPYQAAAMRWWRLRPVPGGVMFETSPDAVTWTLRATSTRSPSMSYDVRIIGGTIGGVAAPGSAKFESVNRCPS